MKFIIKKLLAKRNITCTDDIIPLIEKSKCKVVSFDIFDTLIKRNVRNPHDVFSLLEHKFCKHFGKNIEIKELRLNAEKMANSNSKYEEVNIDEIYNKFQVVTDDEKEWLKKTEIELELMLCQKNPRIAPIFDWCINNGIKVIISSDMYLSLETIKMILSNAGYISYSNIYLSNQYRLKKATGNLFNKIIETEKISHNDLLHIGDSYIGDYINPKKLGIKTILIAEKDQDTQYYNKKNSSIEYNVINSYVKNNEPDGLGFYEKIGYEIVGPILYGFTKWLIAELDNENIDKLFFLAREGFLLDNAFRVFDCNKSIKHVVIRVSRKATTLPLLYKCKNFDELLDCITVTRSGFTVDDLLSSCELSREQIELCLDRLNFNKSIKISSLTTNQKKQIFKCIKGIIYDISKEQEECIRGYMKSFGFEGKIAVADVGWNGTIQNSLIKIFPNNEIIGYYIGKKQKSRENNVLSKAYLFENDKTNYIQQEIMSCVDLFELFFLSVDGSAKKYGINKVGNYYCIQEQSEKTKNNAIDIITLQNFAIRFVEEFYSLDNVIDLEISAEAATAAYSKFIRHLSSETLKQVKKFSFLNVEQHSMVAKHGLAYYLLNPRYFIEEFLNNGSKVIFLKSIFKLPLPYVSIVSFLKKYDKN